MLPKYLILDTKNAVMYFDSFLRTLPPSFDHTTEGCVLGIFGYLVDKENCQDDVYGYLDELYNELQTGQQDPILMDRFIIELEELARALWEQLVVYRIYTHSGINWYYPHSLIGFDLVLELSDDEETVREDLNGTIL
jgi:hypothetical protein